MRILGEKGLGNLLKIILQIFLYVGSITIIVLPFILQKFGINFFKSLIIFYPNGLVLLLITYEFIKQFDSLKNNNPFCMGNVVILRKTAIISLVGSVLWFLIFLYETILVNPKEIVFILILVFLTILFFGVSIALYILSELLNQATKYKEENDLTI